MASSSAGRYPATVPLRRDGSASSFVAPLPAPPQGNDGMNFATARKRVREGDLVTVDGTALVDMGAAPPTKKKKKGKRSKLAEDLAAQTAQDSSAPATYTTKMPGRYPVGHYGATYDFSGAIKHSLSGGLQSPPDVDTSPSTYYLDEFIPHPIADLQENYDLAEREVTKLQLELEESNLQIHHERQLKQDLYFEMDFTFKKFDTKTKKMQRDMHFKDKEIKALTEEVKKLKGDNAQKEAKVMHAQADANRYRDEVEHLQTLNQAVEADLDHLRTIEIEAAAARVHAEQKMAHELPPAYGSIEDGQRFPHVYKDSGTFDVVAFKRCVRTEFKDQLVDAKSWADSVRASGSAPELTSKLDAHVFVSASSALTMACKKLKPALLYAENVIATHMKSFGDLKETIALRDRLPVQEVQKRQQKALKRHVAARDYVCDRVAKLILDLSWRIISSHELRPITIRITANEKAVLALMYKETDEVLLEALQGAHRDMWDLQHYHSQIVSLRGEIGALRAGVSYEYFNKTLQWLGEQIESARIQEEDLDGEPMNDGEVSSAMSSNVSESESG